MSRYALAFWTNSLTHSETQNMHVFNQDADSVTLRVSQHGETVIIGSVIIENRVITRVNGSFDYDNGFIMTGGAE